MGAVKTNSKIKKSGRIATTIAPKSIARTRQDIKSWKTAQNLTRMVDYPKWYLLQNLYDEIEIDALLTSQYKNRLLKSISKKIVLKNKSGDIDTEQTKIINKAIWSNDINKHILETNYRGYSVIELSFKDKELQIDLIPRQNIDPRNGIIYPDYTDDANRIFYRDEPEFGVWLLEFKEKDNLGLWNKAVPHVLIKRFAQSCWSELCEIYGIPPRVLKTNTQDPAMVKRGESMMKDMGAAAWFIIDESESFEWAKGVTTSGDVYSNLITLCNNENSMLVSGAIIGQDTKNGSNSKEVSSQQLLKTLIDSDLRKLEQQWNTVVIPALVKLGVLKGDLTYNYEPSEDLAELWKMTHEALPYYKIKEVWIKEKFGIEIEGVREAQQPANLSLEIKDHEDFFV